MWLAVHEIGHSLGLEHSKDVNSVMHPWQIGKAGGELSDGDIKGIEALYGETSLLLSRLLCILRPLCLHLAPQPTGFGCTQLRTTLLHRFLCIMNASLGTILVMPISSSCVDGCWLLAPSTAFDRSYFSSCWVSTYHPNSGCLG